jgi:hypothetical protein
MLVPWGRGCGSAKVQQISRRRCRLRLSRREARFGSATSLLTTFGGHSPHYTARRVNLPKSTASRIGRVKSALASLLGCSMRGSGNQRVLNGNSASLQLHTRPRGCRLRLVLHSVPNGSSTETSQKCMRHQGNKGSVSTAWCQPETSGSEGRLDGKLRFSVDSPTELNIIVAHRKQSTQTKTTVGRVSPWSVVCLLSTVADI